MISNLFYFSLTVNFELVGLRLISSTIFIIKIVLNILFVRSLFLSCYLYFVRFFLFDFLHYVSLYSELPPPPPGQYCFPSENYIQLSILCQFSFLILLHLPLFSHIYYLILTLFFTLQFFSFPSCI